MPHLLLSLGPPGFQPANPGGFVNFRTVLGIEPKMIKFVQLCHQGPGISRLQQRFHPPQADLAFFRQQLAFFRDGPTVPRTPSQDRGKHTQGGRAIPRHHRGTVGFHQGRLDFLAPAFLERFLQTLKPAEIRGFRHGPTLLAAGLGPCLELGKGEGADLFGQRGFGFAQIHGSPQIPTA